MEQLIEGSIPFPGFYEIYFFFILYISIENFFITVILDTPLDIPRYNCPQIQVKTEKTIDNKSIATDNQDQQIDKLRVNLFSGWGENSMENEEISSNQSSEVEMLDSSNTKQD